MHRLPKEFRWSTLDARELPGRVKSASAVERARDAVTAMRVVLFGQLGSGKSSLAVAIGRAAMDARHENGLYVTALELDRARSENSYGRGDASLVERAVEVPILVLDELGAEKGGSGTVAEVLDQRQRECRQTILVSVLTTDGLREQYAGGALRKAFGGAMVIVCDGEQPDGKPVRRVEARAAWTPPPPRPAMVAVAAELAGVTDPAEYRRRFDAFVECFGGGPVARAPSTGPLRDVDYGEADEHVTEHEGEETGT